MKLCLYINCEFVKDWPITFPKYSQDVSQLDICDLKDKHVADMITEAKIDLFELLEFDPYEFRIEAKACVQPKDVEIHCYPCPAVETNFTGKWKHQPKEPPEAPVIKLEKPVAEYSNVKSLYK